MAIQMLFIITANGLISMSVYRLQRTDLYSHIVILAHNCIKWLRLDLITPRL